jgi:hypothetical protein
MSWGAQNRSKDAKTPSVAGGRSDKPELDRCPIQPYTASGLTYDIRTGLVAIIPPEYWEEEHEERPAPKREQRIGPPTKTEVASV